jgi:diaminohydroxyphosphoribosylaminopyrimidine deaminase/5-amino-6-(5-phosphoribosylamino)uracil reductase
VSEAAAMDRALALAWNGWGRVHPNPLVGAVVLHDNAIVGEGWHAEYGDVHAEVAAIRAAGPRAREATMVVTLEPCRHQGRQPPCVDAIRAAGIRRLVFGANDPNPAAGGGAAVLAAGGLEVATVPMTQAVRDQNAAFFHGFAVPDRPFVALKLATSVDGKVADYTGRSQWLSGPEAREWVHWLRAGFDAIGVGGHTARLDDPALTVRGPVAPRVAPRRVVFDRRGDLGGARQLLATARDLPVLVVTEPDPDRATTDGLAGAGVTLLPAAGLPEGMRRLREEGVRSLLVEGGGRLAARLMAEGLVDRFYWVQSPLWLGDAGLPAFAGLAGGLVESAARWRVIERRALGPDTLLVLGKE